MPLPSIEEYRKGEPARAQTRGRRSSATRSTTSRRRATRPAGSASSPTSSSPAMTYDEVELSSTARLPRPAVLPGAGRDQLRPALAEREVREEPRARAVQDPDQGGRQAARQELQETSRSRSRRPSSRSRRADATGCRSGREPRPCGAHTAGSALRASRSGSFLAAHTSSRTSTSPLAVRVLRPRREPGAVRVARLHELQQRRRHLLRRACAAARRRRCASHQVGVVEPEADVHAVERADAAVEQRRLPAEPG